MAAFPKLNIVQGAALVLVATVMVDAVGHEEDRWVVLVMLMMITITIGAAFIFIFSWHGMVSIEWVMRGKRACWLETMATTML